jgi:hypothetical protein
MPEPLTLDDLNARVEKVIDVLPESLGADWVDDLSKKWDGLVKLEEEHGLDENETALLFAFWDAARAVIRDLLAHGDLIHLARTPISD